MPLAYIYLIKFMLHVSKLKLSYRSNCLLLSHPVIMNEASNASLTSSNDGVVSAIIYTSVITFGMVIIYVNVFTLYSSSSSEAWSEKIPLK